MEIFIIIKYNKIKKLIVLFGGKSMAEKTYIPFISITINSIEALTNISQIISPCIFRGQSNSSWNISTSIERIIPYFDKYSSLLRKSELDVLTDFQRHAANYIEYKPEINNYIDWLSLMQHHGAPTRLLDFTRSIYIAAFFASENYTDSAAIWAIKKKPINDFLSKQTNMRSTPWSSVADENYRREYVNKSIKDSLDCSLDLSIPKVFDKHIIYVEPYIVHKRLSAQQGVFLFPNDITSSFHDNLAAIFNCSTFDPNKPALTEEYNPDTNNFLSLIKYDLIKIIINKKAQLNILNELKKMNITAETLYPGLDGYSRSLRHYFLNYQQFTIYEE